jgi:hypothetical protein
VKIVELSGKKENGIFQRKNNELETNGKNKISDTYIEAQVNVWRVTNL